MKILGIDTALGACSVALLDGERILGRARAEMQRGHAEALAPMVADTITGAGVTFSALERIAVTTGPGTFTGQRVGLAFARALALGLKIPAVGVTTLDAMSAQALEEENAQIAISVCDAKRGEVYLGGRNLAGEAVLEPALAPLSDAVERIGSIARMEGKLVLAGTGAALIESSFSGFTSPTVFAANVCQPDAIYVARLGAAVTVSEAPPKPLYLRAPDAKLPKRPFA